MSPSAGLVPQCPGSQVMLESSPGCGCPPGMVKVGDNCTCPVGFTLEEGAAECKGEIGHDLLQKPVLKGRRQAQEH